MWSFKLYLARSTSYEIPYAIFTCFILLHPSQAQIFSSELCFQTPSLYDHPITSETNFHMHTKKIKLVYWGVESNCVHSALRPPIGLLCQPGVIMMMEKLVEWWLGGETEIHGENLPECRFVNYKHHIHCLDANTGRRGGKSATNILSYGTAPHSYKTADNITFMHI
jgi:hypothetical protein